MRRRPPISKCSQCGKTITTHGGRSVCIECRRAELQSPENRAKNIVRQVANRAIRQGLLVRQPCEVCCAEKVDAHHDDYAKPLDIRWLCRGCHKRHHVKFGPGKNAYAATATQGE